MPDLIITGCGGGKTGCHVLFCTMCHRMRQNTLLGRLSPGAASGTKPGRQPLPSRTRHIQLQLATARAGLLQSALNPTAQCAVETVVHLRTAGKT